MTLQVCKCSCEIKRFADTEAATIYITQMTYSEFGSLNVRM